jgi:L-asparaginase II
MDPLRIEVTRGSLVESIHRVTAAVVDPDGTLVAASGDPDLVAPWRSAAKPFQSLPLLRDGAAERFALTDQDLALACASHSSEPTHLAAVDAFLARVGIPESALACGPHPPLSDEVAMQVARNGISLTPRWSNCSGKHTGLLALAKHHAWPLEGYERLGHPVQERVIAEVERWTGLGRDRLVFTVDGCATVCFGLPLRAMALAYARFGSSAEPAARRLWRAITAHPLLIAGSTRFDTLVMQAWPDDLFVKVGAEGIYSAAVARRGWGIALKVEDGAFRAAPIALLAILRLLLHRAGGGPELDALERLTDFVEPPIRNTRGNPVGTMRTRGGLRFSDA